MQESSPVESQIDEKELKSAKRSTRIVSIVILVLALLDYSSVMEYKNRIDSGLLTDLYILYFSLLAAGIGYWMMKKWAVIIYGVSVAVVIIWTLDVAGQIGVGWAHFIILYSMYTQWKKGVLE